jgi:pimeloyl-ACP methyl ester carboxylesterase
MSPRTAERNREFIVPGDVPIQVTIHPGSGPAVVLIHGITSSGAIWEPILADLGERFAPVAIDLRGHGDSGKPDSGYLYDDYIGDLDRVLEHLGLARPLIVGHSLGGLITLWWAARHPERSPALVIEDSPLHSGEDFRPAFDNWIRLNGMDLPELRQHYASENPSWKPAAVERRARQMHATARQVLTELKADSMTNHDVDRLAEIEHVASPVLLIHGDVETGGMVGQAQAADFGRRLPNATVARIPGASHNLHLSRGREFLAHAMPFLERHAAKASHLADDIP